MAKVDYAAIADEVSSKGYADYNAAFTAMSAETVTKDKDIQVADIKAYLTLVGKRLAIEESTDISAKTARLSFADFESYRLTENPAYLVQLTSVLDALVSDGLIDAGDKTAILALGQDSEPKWKGLKPGHIQNAIQYRAKGAV